MRVPAPLAGRLIGNGEGGGEQVFDWGAHGPGDRTVREPGRSSRAFSFLTWCERMDRNVRSTASR